MNQKFKKRILKDWLVVIGIFVLGVTATYLYVINSSSFDTADIGSRWVSGLSSGVIGVRAVAGASREKILHFFDARSGAEFQPSGDAGSAAGSGKQSSDRAGLFVAKVIDGDTLRLSNGSTIRLVGADAPKPGEYFGDAASAYTKEEIEGKTVVLEYDAQTKDRGGVTLAYVHRRSDNFFLNAEIIRHGFGFADANYPFNRREEFRADEEKARLDKRGQWAEPE